MNFSDWEYRRTEIGAQIQNYEIGTKPTRPDTITASYSGGVLTVNVTVKGKVLTLTSQVILPSGTGPFPAVIGMNSPSGSIPSSIFSSRNIAQITFNHDQVSTYGNPQVSNPYYQLYPNLNPTNTGQYSAWSWGVSRIIDGLELVQNVLPIDLKHIAVTGCSYAGKLALFAGALDERVALTIAQESGGGGATSWRYSRSLPSDTVEDIDNTDYNWFMDAMKQFNGNNVSYLPEDHHELMAMVAPRALYVTANPSFTWLSNQSCDVASRAAETVYHALGIDDRFGFSIIGGHNHCAVPDTQLPEIGAFVDKFLLGKDTVNTNISDSPYSINLSPWITWTTPTLLNGTSYFGRTSLIFPVNLQKGMDTAITFQWNKANDAQKYIIELSNDLTFANNVIIDSTTDTSKSISGLLKSKLYNWRVRIESSSGPGPWSDVWQLTTAGPLPSKPQLIVVTTPDSSLFGYLGFKFHWKKASYADQYLIQISNDSTFVNINASSSTSDTVKELFGFLPGNNYYWRVQASNAIGLGPWSDASIFPQSETAIKANGGKPMAFSLSQNYPNPFNPTSIIKFALPKAALTKIIVYDILGREIQVLIDKELVAGFYEVSFDANHYPSGVYFYRIQSGSFVQTKKMIFMK
ncbi:MAG TPA: T9SS type A sorting domain-containing protein [Bacteroidota bacterium]|nr:T9SS type A sorting domain-containing protein [Bacteroidota bacterium]